MSIGFEQPFMAVAALVIIPLIIFLSRFFGNPFAVSLPLGAPGGIPFKPPVKIGGLIRALRILEYCGVFLLFLGAAGPQITSNKTIWLGRGVDILFILDSSPSMAALDMNGASRFNAARGLLRDFSAHRPADNIGLVAAGSEASLLLAPSGDREILYERLDQLRIGELGDGTALGDALALAAYHMEKSQAERKAVILITDGENNAGAVHPETAAKILGNMGISLWVIGIGSGGNVPIDYTDPVTNIRRTGAFDSRYNPENLRSISRAAGGELLLAPTADALSGAFARIDDRETVVARAGVTSIHRSFRVPVLVSALALLAGVRIIRRFFMGALR